MENENSREAFDDIFQQICCKMAVISTYQLKMKEMSKNKDEDMLKVWEVIAGKFKNTDNIAKSLSADIWRLIELAEDTYVNQGYITAILDILSPLVADTIRNKDLKKFHKMKKTLKRYEDIPLLDSIVIWDSIAERQLQ